MVEYVTKAQYNAEKNDLIQKVMANNVDPRHLRIVFQLFQDTYKIKGLRGWFSAHKDYFVFGLMYMWMGLLAVFLGYSVYALVLALL